MNPVLKSILTIVFILAVIVYTVFNFISGKIDSTMFLVCMVVLCLPLLNMINIMIRDRKNK